MNLNEKSNTEDIVNFLTASYNSAIEGEVNPPDYWKAVAVDLFRHCRAHGIEWNEYKKD
jgi:hypothetical protein